MAAVTPNINQARAMRVAMKRIEGFAKQYGEAHRNLARHAAFPFVLTPDLLYQIWANFVPEAPWTAVAHVLLSRLCRQVDYEMYEMDITDRNLLLRELKEQFGQERFDELGEFLLDYVAQRLTEDDADTQDWREAQEWTALAYTQPSEAARELAEAIASRVKQDDMGEVFRLASLVETFAEPLVEAGFEPLLIYTRGAGSFVRGDLEVAVEQFSQVLNKEGKVKIAGVSLDIPLEEQSVSVSFSHEEPAHYQKRNHHELRLEEALSFIDTKIVAQTGSYLSELEKSIFQAAWESLTDVPPSIVTYPGLSERGVAERFWLKLSYALEREVNQINLKSIVEQYWQSQIAETQNHQKSTAVVTEISDDDQAESDKEYPLGHVKKTPKSRIRHLREKRGITQVELARYWGVSPVTVQSWEKETSKAHHLVNLVLLCHLLSCTPRDFVSDLPPSTPGSNQTKNLERIRQQVLQEEYSTSDNSPLPVTRIAELRESKGLTQSELADALDVSVHTIQNWESGRTSWRQFVQFIKLCDILGCTPEELVDDIPQERISAVEKLLQNKSKIGVDKEPAQQKQLAQDIESEDV